MGNLRALFAPGTRHHEFALEDPFKTAKLRSDFLETPCLSPQDNHFQAEVMLEVGMERGNHHVGIVVLEFHQLIAKLWAVVIVDERKRARHVLLFGLPCPPRQCVADQLSNGLAPRGKLLLPAEAIKLFQEIVFQRDGETDDFRHNRSPSV